MLGHVLHTTSVGGAPVLLRSTQMLLGFGGDFPNVDFIGPVHHTTCYVPLPTCMSKGEFPPYDAPMGSTKAEHLYIFNSSYPQDHNICEWVCRRSGHFELWLPCGAYGIVEYKKWWLRRRGRSWPRRSGQYSKRRRHSSPWGWKQLWLQPHQHTNSEKQFVARASHRSIVNSLPQPETFKTQFRT